MLKYKTIIHCNLEKTIKEEGTKALYCHIIQELADLALNGIVLNINNQQIKVYFLMGIFQGDRRLLPFLLS